MLDKDRVKEAEANVRRYLQEGLLRKVAPIQQVLDVLRNNARESLLVAEALNEQQLSDLWVIVCSYYAMFYHANAILVSLGHKVGDKVAHKVTADALIVYVRGKLRDSLLEDYEEVKEEALNLAGIRADSLIESFEAEREKRSIIQYETAANEKQAKATTSVRRAKEFGNEMEKILIAAKSRKPRVA